MTAPPMKITVLTGGTSAERDVAIASAVQIVAALRQRGHRVAVVDTARGFIPETDERRVLSATVGTAPPPIDHLIELERGVLLSGLANLPVIRSADVLFLALHGGRGEDGTLQAVLDVLDVPYTGSGALASGLAMDKDLSKRLFRSVGVPTADWLMGSPSADLIATTLGWPVVVKPSKQGSTVGLSLVKGPEELPAALDLAGKYDDEIMTEAFVPGRELTVGILDGKALAVGEIIPKHELFDYECKYTPGMALEVFPADLTAAVARRVQVFAESVHAVLKLGGYSRVDFRLTPAGEPVCLEVNTLPGMTATSLLPQSAQASGISFAELCERICLTARGGSKV